MHPKDDAGTEELAPGTDLAIPHGERVTLHRPLPGVELWSVRSAARLWTLFHTTYAFCALDPGSDGSERWRHRGVTYLLRPGSTMLLEPGELQVTTSREGRADFHVLLLSPDVVEAELGAAGSCRPSQRHFEHALLEDAGVVQRYQQLWRALEDTDAPPSQQRALLRDYLAAVFRRAGEEPPRAAAVGCARAVKRSREILESQFNQRITLDHLARETGLSKFHLDRSFHQAVGLPIHQYLKKVRVARALSLLRSGRRPAAVAPLTGFSDQPHMTRVFRNELGFTPRLYWAGGSIAPRGQA